MSNVFPIGAKRLERALKEKRKRTEREAYADALRLQHSRPLEDWEIELNAMIGAPGGDQ